MDIVHLTTEPIQLRSFSFRIIKFLDLSVRSRQIAFFKIRLGLRTIASMQLLAKIHPDLQFTLRLRFFQGLII